MGLVDPPRKLLEKVRGITFCELPNVEECCGFGGTFSVKMPGASLAMGQTKVENIVKTGAEVVVSLDISCLMHVGGILRRNPATRHIRTMHMAELLVADGLIEYVPPNVPRPIVCWVPPSKLVLYSPSQSMTPEPSS